MERINIPEPIQLESMRSTDLTVARGYNRQEALLDPRVEAVLHYTAEDNIPVLRHTQLGGRRSPKPTPTASKHEGTIPTRPCSHSAPKKSSNGLVVVQLEGWVSIVSPGVLGWGLRVIGIVLQTLQTNQRSMFAPRSREQLPEINEPAY